jgi:serine protease Do
MGIISASERGEEEMPDYLQTDAAIHPGSSGGALVNLKGELVGINSAFLLTAAGENSGIGFALPVNSAKEIFYQIARSGYVLRGWMGIELQDIRPALARSFGFRGTYGALVNDVVPGGPGERAGILSGDIIAELDQKAITNAHQLYVEIAKSSPGKTVQIKVFRKGVVLLLNVTIDKSPALHSNQPEAKGQSEVPLDGVDLETLTPEVATKLNLPVSIQGVLVTFVNQGSVASASGLRIGDVIQEVNGIRVIAVEDVGEILANLQDKNPVRLLIHRNRHKQYIALE